MESIDTKIIIAFIAAIVSFLGLIISKEQKISEFRQIWINNLRNDISSLMGNLTEYNTRWLVNEPGLDEIKFKNFLNENHSLINDLLKLKHSISLRLNKHEHEDILINMDEIYKSIVFPTKDNMGKDFQEKTEHFIFLSHKILKSEWERVKKGEPIFKFSKYLVLSMIAVTVLYLGYKEFKVVSAHQESNVSSKLTSNK